MPIKSVRLIPGVNVERTPTLNEAGISASALGRFRDALFQKIGGWTQYVTASSGVPRAMHVWQDLNAQARLAVGSTTAFDVSTDQVLTTLTPRSLTSNVPGRYIQTTAGSSSVYIRDDNLAAAPAAFLTTSDGVFFNTPVSVGGLVLSGFYPVTAVGSSEAYYYIQAASAATVTSSLSTSVVTISIASPAVVTWAAHGLVAGTPVDFATTGALPTGLTAGSIYYVLAAGLGANSFQVGLYPAAAAINTSGSQSGIQTCTAQGGVVPSFSTSSGSSVVTVTLPNHGLSVGSDIVFPISTSVNGTAILGGYTVIAVADTSRFTIAASSVATATSTEPTPMNGGSFRFVYYISLGPQAAGAGYGSGVYGSGTYGFGTSPAVQTGTAITANHWTIDNWGQDVVACPESGGVYYWNPSGGFATLTQILTAPPFNEGIFVSMPQRILVAYGSTASGDIGVQQDPLLIRWR